MFHNNLFLLLSINIILTIIINGLKRAYFDFSSSSSGFRVTTGAREKTQDDLYNNNNNNNNNKV